MGAGCLRDASARVTVEIINLALSALSVQERIDLSRAYARDISLTCGVNDLSVVDVQGKNASVSIEEDGTVTAYVLSIGDGSSANALAASLYSSAFRGSLESTTLDIVGRAMDISVGAVTFKPEAFVAPIPTTTTKFVPPTATSTATNTATGTSTSTTVSPSPVSTAVTTITEAITSTSTSSGGGTMETTGGPTGPAWQWFVVGGVAVGGAAAVILLLFQKSRKHADAPALDV